MIDLFNDIYSLIMICSLNSGPDFLSLICLILFESNSISLNADYVGSE